MKTIIAFAFATTLCLSAISCGQSKTDIKADSLQNDSTQKEMNNTGDHMIDSMNAANDAANKAQKKADSIHLADSLAKLKKK
ncbi:MAG: hypothetical protein NT084_03160 [Bacteroidetes bacterium]|jgi:hypothetical protein|nr:hypothetical protein [Bacteroidota bacterium]